MSNDEEYNQYYLNWIRSLTYKKFINDLQGKREYLYANYSMTMKEEDMLSREELIAWLNEIVEFYDLDTNEKVDREYEKNVPILANDIPTLSKRYVDLQLTLHFYLKHYLSREEYEIAAYLRDVIQIAELEVQRKVMWYYINEEEIKYIINELYEIIPQIRKQFDI